MTPIQAAIEFLENDEARTLLGLNRIRVGEQMLTRGELAELLKQEDAQPQMPRIAYVPKTLAEIDADDYLRNAVTVDITDSPQNEIIVTVRTAEEVRLPRGEFGIDTLENRANTTNTVLERILTGLALDIWPTIMTRLYVATAQSKKTDAGD